MSVFLGVSHSSHPKGLGPQRSPIFGVPFYLCIYPLTQNDQIMCDKGGDLFLWDQKWPVNAEISLFKGSSCQNSPFPPMLLAGWSCLKLKIPKCCMTFMHGLHCKIVYKIVHWLFNCVRYCNVSFFNVLYWCATVVIINAYSHCTLAAAQCIVIGPVCGFSGCICLFVCGSVTIS